MTTTAPIPPIAGAVTIAVPIDRVFSDAGHASEIHVSFTANG